MPSKTTKEQKVKDRLYIDLFQSIYRMQNEHDPWVRFMNAIERSGQAVIKGPIDTTTKYRRAGYSKARVGCRSGGQPGHENRILAHITRVRSDPRWEPKPAGPHIEPRRHVYNRIRHLIGKKTFPEIYRITESHYKDARSFTSAMCQERTIRAAK